MDTRFIDLLQGRPPDLSTKSVERGSVGRTRCRRSIWRRKAPGSRMRHDNPWDGFLPPATSEMFERIWPASDGDQKICVLMLRFFDALVKASLQRWKSRSQRTRNFNRLLQTGHSHRCSIAVIRPRTPAFLADGLWSRDTSRSNFLLQLQVLATNGQTLFEHV